MATYVYRCQVCDQPLEVHSDTIEIMGLPSHCEVAMKRDYKSESVGVTFQGGGWARKSN